LQTESLIEEDEEDKEDDSNDTGEKIKTAL
jgi:hypothetical protein